MIRLERGRQNLRPVLLPLEPPLRPKLPLEDERLLEEEPEERDEPDDPPNREPRPRMRLSALLLREAGAAGLAER